MSNKRPSAEEVALEANATRFFRNQVMQRTMTKIGLTGGWLLVRPEGGFYQEFQFSPIHDIEHAISLFRRVEEINPAYATQVLSVAVDTVADTDYSQDGTEFQPKKFDQIQLVKTCFWDSRWLSFTIYKILKKEHDKEIDELLGLGKK